MLTGEHSGDPRQNNAPSVLTRILTALGYEPPDDASSLEPILNRAYNASEDARPFFDWLCAAFEDALDGSQPQVSLSSLGTSWSVLSEEESEAYEELRALGFLDDSALAEFSDEAVDDLDAPASVDEELEASIALLSEQLKQVREHVKVLDVQHQCLLNSQEGGASKSSVLAKQECVAQQALVDLDTGVRALSLQMDAAVTEAASAAGKLADLALAEHTPPTARPIHHHPPPPAYLHQCAAEIAAWNNADDDLDARLVSCMDGIYPRDPREPDLPIFADSLPAEGGPPVLDLPAELAAELERLTGLYSITERDQHIALLRATYSKEQLKALEERLADRNATHTSISHPALPDPTAETMQELVTLQHLWESIATRSTSIPFLASVYSATRADRASRLDAATALTQDSRASLARATLLHYNLCAERRALREQGAAMLAVAEHVTTADTSLTQQITALSTTTKVPARDAGDAAFAGFLTRITQTRAEIRSGNGPDVAHNVQEHAPWERITVRETLPRLITQTDTLRTVLCEHTLTAVPLLAPKALLDGEQAVKEATSDLGRALRDAAAMAAAAGGAR
ncbi:hypothetical protein HDU88_004225 [Geranomyces variabilis]|nr:hypothetical protein HDU88_004225 [Geranomyces variabilis]